MLRKALISVFICVVHFVGAQIPVINSVTPLSTYPQNKIVIVGSGFNAGGANMQVWFDQVKGTIDLAASSEFSITATVPSQARFSNIEVLNLTSGLSAKTNSKFMPSFHGSAFDPANFAAPVTLLAGNTVSVNDHCTCDLDMDGKPDISATQSTGTSMMFFKNTSTPGSVSFAAATTVAIATSTNNSACGDLDGDGKPEVLVSRDGTRNEVWIFKNNSSVGTITMAAPTNATKLFLDPGQNSFRISVRDLNADGKPEVIVSNSTSSATNTVYVFLNAWSTKGTIAFNPVPIKLLINGASSTYGLDAQDLDGDGKPEIIVNQFNSSGVFILKNTSAAGTVTFASPVKIDVAGSLNHLTTADFNNDGKLDIAVTSNSGAANNVLVLLNQSTSSTLTFSAPITLSAGDSPWGIDVADMDGDGDADIIVANIINAFVSQTKEITVFSNDGNASFTHNSITANVKRSKNIKVGDVDGDGKPDITYIAINDAAPAVSTNNSVEVLRNTNCFVPSILNTGTLVICPGQTIHLNSIPNAGSTFDWKNAANTSLGSTPDLDVTTNDIYTVTAISEGGSCSKSASITVNSGAGTVVDPTITVNTPACSGTSLNLQTADASPNTYQWTGPNNFTSTSQNPVINNITSANAGVYTLQIANASGCKSNVISKTVDVANLANFVVSTSVPSNQICQGSSLTLSVNTAAGYTYQWVKDGVDIGGQTSSTLVVSSAGSYKVRVSRTSPTCSVDTSPISVSAFAMPTSSFTPSTTSTCVNQNVSFTNQSTFDANATTVYAWNFGDAGSSTIAEPSHTYTTANTFAAQLTVSYPGITGCSATSTKNIVVASPTIPVINATVNPICPGDASVLSAAGSFTSYAWTGPATGSGSSLNITQPGTYSVATTESNGCSSNGQLVVTSKTVPTLSITANTNSVVAGQPVTVAPGSIIQLEAAGANSYSWSPPDGISDPTIANPTATVTSNISYTLTGTLTGGCSSQRIVDFVIDAALGNWQAPNVFSPNGDGNHDMWVIPSITNYPDCTMSIFNRQGSKVFEQRGYANNWDGMYNGKELPQGTYYYVLGCPDKSPITGHVLLAR